MTNLKGCLKSKIKLIHGIDDIISIQHSYLLKKLFNTFNFTTANNVETDWIEGGNDEENAMIKKKYYG